jgi:tetratricopeptide (TPR) repeat protein
MPGRSLLAPALIVAGVAGLLVAGLPAVMASEPAASAPRTATASASGQAPGSPAGRTSLAAAIAAAQQRLRTFPRDDLTWAQLGSAYVQQARVTVDPSYYPKAEGALRRSLALRPEGNAPAFTGRGSLANARHEFAQALSWGRKALAANPYDSTAYGVVADAQTQLGDYAAADAAIQKMLDLQPGLASFSRASYAFEQRGNVAAARASMQRALAESTDPADIAFCRYYLGELSFNEGDPKAALEQYRLGLLASPDADTLLAGRAKSNAALGRVRAALADYAEVVARVPLPEYVLEYAQLLQAQGQAALARQQFALLDSIQQLFTANGVVDDLTAAVVDADHGSASSAVRHARAEWDRRRSVLVADALAWALHRDGQHAAALTYAREANRLGWKNATFAYHLGMIELSLGRRDDARRHLSAALAINPYFSPVQAPVAAAALRTLGGPR